MSHYNDTADIFRFVQRECDNLTAAMRAIVALTNDANKGIYTRVAEIQAIAMRALDGSECGDIHKSLAIAYGYLWHVNNEPVAPIPMFSQEQAAYRARQELRGMLTSEERAKGIESAGAELAKVRP